MTENNKIISSKITSVSSGKQKRLTQEIKKAKILGLYNGINSVGKYSKFRKHRDKVQVKNGYRNFLLKQGKL